MTSYEDQLDQPPAEGWRPEPGDKVVGTVTDVGSVVSTYGEYPVITIEPKDGKAVAVHAFHSALKSRVLGAGLAPGDVVGVKYLGVQQTRGGQDFNNYHFKVFEKNAPKTEAPVAAPASTPSTDDGDLF